VSSTNVVDVMSISAFPCINLILLLHHHSFLLLRHTVTAWKQPSIYVTRSQRLD